MKWKIIHKNNKYRRKLVLDDTDWLILTMVIGFACIVLMSEILEGV